MASSKFFVISFLFLVLAINLAASEEPDASQPLKPVLKIVDVVVEGVVNCQSCDHYGTWNLADAKPIQAATISVICKDHRNRVSYYKACETDKNGYFYVELKDFKMSHYFLDHPLHACKVKLVSSPLSTCNLLTNVNYGLYGSPLHYEDKKVVGDNYEAVVYSTRPLAFRPAQCTPKAEAAEVADQLPEH